MEALLAADFADRPPGHSPLYNTFAQPDSRGLALGLLSARLGDSATALERALAFERSEPGARGPERGAIIRAALAHAGERHEEVLALLGTGGFGTAPTAIGFAALFRGDALQALGRWKEALAWYGAVSGDGPLTILHDAPLHLRRARLLDARGDGAAAARHYRRVLEIWTAPDSALAPDIEQIRRRLGRTPG